MTEPSHRAVPIIGLLTLVASGFPIPASIALILWSLGRVAYFVGYSSSVAARANILAILLQYPALLALIGLNIATAVFLFQGTAPY